MKQQPELSLAIQALRQIRVWAAMGFNQFARDHVTNHIDKCFAEIKSIQQRKNARKFKISKRP